MDVADLTALAGQAGCQFGKEIKLILLAHGHGKRIVIFGQIHAAGCRAEVYDLVFAVDRSNSKGTGRGIAADNSDIFVVLSDFGANRAGFSAVTLVIKDIDLDLTAIDPAIFIALVNGNHKAVGNISAILRGITGQRNMHSNIIRFFRRGGVGGVCGSLSVGRRRCVAGGRICFLAAGEQCED